VLGALTVCDAPVTRLRMAVTLVAASLALPAVAAVPAAAAPAPAGAPGALSHYDLARKDCVGTARNTTSKVWFTVAGGVLSDVYAPTVDNTNVETLQYVVTGPGFTDLQTRDMTYTVSAIDPGGMACRVVSTPRRGGYKLVTDYLTDPQRDSVVIRTRLDGPAALKVFVRYDATMNGNGGGGGQNGGADDATVDPATTALVSSDPDTVTNAPNRDYAVPMYGALRADRPFRSTQSGYAGTASDGLTQLDTARALSGPATAPDGNVVQTAEVARDRAGSFTLALGYGRTAASAIATAGASAATSFTATYARYVAGWIAYDAQLRRPPTAYPGLSRAQALRLVQAYYLSVNVVKASEDKTFPGAIAAGLGAPWGQAISAGDLPGGKPRYFGSYRYVFARDLYEAFTGVLTAGDTRTAQAATRFLFQRQQQADGRMPRNSLINGLKGPDSGGDQLDETAYPVLMAWQSGLAGDRALWPRVKKAADFVVSRGPSFGSERWEEQGGYSPSTIAAQIAGLVAGARIADVQGDADSARVYRATADHFQRSVKGWTVTTTGPYSPGRYFIRLSKNGDPDEAVSYGLGNGAPDADQRSVIDAGFLELTRLGILSPRDPDVLATLPVVDATIKRDTASGPGWYRYGTSAPGSEDGYGDCWAADPTGCDVDGRPWAPTGSGSGHVWPVLSGERAEHHLQTGDRRTAAALLASMDRYSSGVGLAPEQAWENPDLPASPFGTAPETASIGFRNGESAGSTSPLTWAQAQLSRLVLSLGANRPVEQPAIVADRYVRSGAPGTLPVTVTAPADGTTVATASVTVTGTTAPGATVDVQSTASDTAGTTTTVTVTASASGAFSARVPTPFGTDVITVAASKGGATGYARRTVNSDFVTGTVVLDVTDPDGDDSGPGTYAYPTAGDFADGAFDLQRFQVIVNGPETLLRAKVRDLRPTFGSPLGAQLLDVYVHTGAPGSTAAAHPSRNYTIAPSSAWSRRIEVEGFADPVFTDAAGNPLGTVSVQASQASGYITAVVPTAALGTPGPGWAFTVVLHGQDGFSADRARGFGATPEGYQFGVCAPGGTSPICSVDPGTVPRAMDTLTSPAELDPTAPPVVLTGVPVL
jgi:glucoamylase